LSECLGTGRTLLREALKQLALEQLVVPPHRTPYGRSLSLTELQPLFETRLLLEAPAFGLAVGRAREAELADMERAVARYDVYETIEIDPVFHSSVAHAIQYRFLAEAINQPNCSSLRLWYLARVMLSLRSVLSWHAEAIEALRIGQCLSQRR
jgi:DNA-binding GntR family transcriptional regulator